jgi:hypothetical protein
MTIDYSQFEVPYEQWTEETLVQVELIPDITVKRTKF